jgi:LysM repeat protein
MLQAGHIIKVPATGQTAFNNAIETSTTGSHQIKKGETVWSISQAYNLSVQSVLDANPGIDIYGLQIGQNLSIPSQEEVIQTDVAETIPSPEPAETIDTVSTETSIEEELTVNETEEIVETTQKPADSTIVEPVVVDNSLRGHLDLSSKKEVIWLLPNSSLGLNTADTTPNAVWEQYQGGHLAIEALQQEGFKIEETLVDVSSKSPKELTTILQPADLVITPVGLNSSLAKINLKQNAAHLNLSAQTSASEAFSLNPVATRQQQTKTLFEYIEEKNGNVIVINENDRKADRSLIEENYPEAQFLKIKSNDSFNENDLINLLISSRLNIVIINSAKTNVYLNTTNALLRQYAKFDVQLAVLDPALIPSNDQISDKRFRILKLIFPSVVQLEKLEAATDLAIAYGRTSDEKLSTHTGLGYDATYDAILRIFQKDGVVSSGNRKAEVSDFLSINYINRYNKALINQEVFLYEYKTDSGFDRLK